MCESRGVRASLPSVLVLLSLLCACQGPRHFAPRDQRTAIGPGGELAAIYEIPPTTPGPALGEVRVWGHAARATGETGASLVELRVGIELENHGSEPLTVDLGSIVCANLVVANAPAPAAPLRPHAVHGEPMCPTGAMTRVDVAFRPPAARPKDITGFAVQFTVRAGERIALTQVTPFGAIDDAAGQGWPYGPAWYGGWYGGWWGYRPYWGPWRPWGPGYGWYWGPGYCW